MATYKQPPHRSEPRAIGSQQENTDRAFLVGAMPQSDTPDNPIVATIKRLFGYGWGHARFVMGPNGLVEHSTVITAKPLPGESIERFMERIEQEYGLQKDDFVEVVANGHRLDIAKITKLPRNLPRC